MFVLVYVVLSLIGIYILFKKTAGRKGKCIPGPNGWPVVGLGFKINQHNMFQLFTTYSSKFGGIFQYTMFGKNIVVLNSADLIRKAFTTEPYRKYMNDRMYTFAGDKVFKNHTLIFTERAFGSTHNNHVKLFTRAMHLHGAGKKEFEEMVQSELVSLSGKVDSFGNEAFDFQDLINRSLINIISILLSGHAVATEDEAKVFWDFDRTSDLFSNQIVDVLMRVFPFLRWIPNVYKKRFDELMDAQTSLIKVYFQDVKARHESGVTRGIVDFMIEEQLQSQKNGEDVFSTDERIKSTIDLLEILAEGVVTTLSNLSSIFLILMNHPEYQKKIQEEIDNVIGSDRLPTLEDRAQCPMVEAVTLEAHRYIPVVPGYIPHECKSNIEFEGYDVPSNSIIIANIYQGYHDETVWGDPWTFRPERFLDTNGDLIPNDNPLRKSWLAFGTGRRQCVGETFARTRVFLFITTLLQRWTFELPPGTNRPCDPRVADLDWNTALRPKPFHCRVVPRRPLHSPR